MSLASPLGTPDIQPHKINKIIEFSRTHDGSCSVAAGHVGRSIDRNLCLCERMNSVETQKDTWGVNQKVQSLIFLAN